MVSQSLTEYVCDACGARASGRIRPRGWWVLFDPEHRVYHACSRTCLLRTIGEA